MLHTRPRLSLQVRRKNGGRSELKAALHAAALYGAERGGDHDIVGLSSCGRVHDPLAWIVPKLDEEGDVLGGERGVHGLFLRRCTDEIWPGGDVAELGRVGEVCHVGKSFREAGLVTGVDVEGPACWSGILIS